MYIKSTITNLFFFLFFAAPTEPPFKCEDNPYIAHCQVVRQVNYCCIPYYQKACCKTCEDLLPDCNK